MAATKPQAVLVWSHGRSGSTLLLDLLASDPQTWAAYEPLQEIRERPHDAWAFGLSGQQSCRDKNEEAAKGNGGVSLASNCPLRDACVLLSLLRCDHMPLLATWFGELDLTGQQAAHLPERLMGPQLGRGSAWLPTQYFGRLIDTRAAGAVADERECHAQPARIVKTIRLNGHLDMVFNVSRALGWAPPIILHLVRDARAIYASRRRLPSPFGLPAALATASKHSSKQAKIISAAAEKHSSKQAKTIQRWARGLCGATQRDSLAGRRLGAAIYEYIDYSSFVRRPVQVVEGLYRRHFNRAVPPEVRQYIAKHLPNRTARGGKPPSALPLSWQFQFGTDARDVEAVDQRWQLELKSWERQAIEVGCPRLRPTPTLLDRVALKIPNM